MRKFIKFTMSKGTPITLSIKQAEKLIDSEDQLFKIPDQNGEWMGQTINKAHIVSTDRDTDKEKAEAENDKMLIPKIDETRNDKDTKKAISKLRNNLFEKKIIRK